MKKAFLLMLFFSVAILVKAQRGNGYHHQNHCYQGNYGNSYCPPPRPFFAPRNYGCNNGFRRPLINVVFAPRPRVVAVQEPVYNQPQLVKEWIEPHWEETSNGRIWVEGHYIQREVY